MALPPQPLIQPKQIHWPGPSEGDYALIMKALSAAGFVWDDASRAWLRKRDDGGTTDEAIEALVEHFPAFVRPVIESISKGAARWDISIHPDPDGSTVAKFIPHFNIVNALGSIGAPAS